ncbi:hypothetical protein C2845_PM09G21060 [Panicum miliaceum]|uniref:Uncharacterized protein n=1 Tax=Panicum miliaceum TaxID=4540 RepID=A0A3L6RYG7_PANMI|nr:hypothetical protein C2845_PM09G21060 [Panicum miliaceum]
MKRIKHLKDKGVTEESMAYSFIERRIQPLQQRVHLGLEYEGIRDPSRMARDVPSVEEIVRRVWLCCITKNASVSQRMLLLHLRNGELHTVYNFSS